MQLNNLRDVSTTLNTESLISTHSVLRNTYLLLSMCLVFSAACAGFAWVTNAQPVNFILMLVGFIGLPFLVMATRNSIWGLVSVFILTGFMGYTLGPMLSMISKAYINGNSIILTTFGTTGLVFFGLSAYVLTTRKNMSFMGGFLFAGLIVSLIAMVANIFLQIPIMGLVISGVMTLIASGYILYDTSAIIEGGETNYIMATVRLFTDIFTLFVHLLNLLTALQGKE
jgi:modulator of FtsH protease